MKRLTFTGSLAEKTIREMSEDEAMEFLKSCGYSAKYLLAELDKKEKIFDNVALSTLKEHGLTEEEIEETNLPVQEYLSIYEEEHGLYK